MKGKKEYHVSVSVSVYLFAIRSTRERTKEKEQNLTIRLSWRGSPKEASGLIGNGLPQINN